MKPRHGKRKEESPETSWDKPSGERGVSWLGWCLFGLLALAACVTVLVPLALQGSAGQAYRRLSEELAERFGVSLTVRDVRFVFPREVVLWGVRLVREGGSREPSLQMDADELRIQPDLTSLLSGYTSLGRIIIRDARISLRLPEAEQVQAKALSPAPSASGAPAGRAVLGPAGRRRTGADGPQARRRRPRLHPAHRRPARLWRRGHAALAGRALCNRLQGFRGRDPALGARGWPLARLPLRHD